MLASPENSVPADLGAREALCQLLSSGRKVSPTAGWLDERGGVRREMQCNGITLHSASRNDGGDPLCLQCRTRGKKNLGTSLFVFIYILQILPARKE